MWCCNLHTIRNVNILQEISLGILNTEKSWEMGNQWTSRTFRNKTACRKFFTFCLLIFLRNWWLPYKEWDRRIHSNWKVKKFLSNSSKDTYAIAIVNCIKKKVPCHSNDCRLKSNLLYKARHLKDKTFFLKPLLRILIRTISVLINLLFAYYLILSKVRMCLTNVSVMKQLRMVT